MFKNSVYVFDRSVDSVVVSTSPLRLKKFQCLRLQSGKKSL